jgi:hypothetical protein
MHFGRPIYGAKSTTISFMLRAARDVQPGANHFHGAPLLQSHTFKNGGLSCDAEAVTNLNDEKASTHVGRPMACTLDVAVACAALNNQHTGLAWPLT